MLQGPELKYETKEEKWIGRAMKRVEDLRLITGDTAFVDDLEISRALYVAVLRSPYAHAKLLKVDCSKALEVRGVVAAVTGEDAKRLTKPLPA